MRQIPQDAFDFKTARVIKCQKMSRCHKPDCVEMHACDSPDFESIPRVHVHQNRLDPADFCIQADPVLRCMKCGTMLNFLALVEERKSGGPQELFRG